MGMVLDGLDLETKEQSVKLLVDFLLRSMWVQIEERSVTTSRNHNVLTMKHACARILRSASIQAPAIESSTWSSSSPLQARLETIAIARHLELDQAKNLIDSSVQTRKRSARDATQESLTPLHGLLIIVWVTELQHLQ
jgi:hypothetical protein